MIENQALVHLTNLVRLFLRNNEIRSLNERMFRNNRKLEWIDVGRNKIKMIDAQTFKNLKNLVEVDLFRNDCFKKSLCPDCEVKISELDVRLERQCYRNYEEGLKLLKEGELDFEFKFANNLIISPSFSKRLMYSESEKGQKSCWRCCGGWTKISVGRSVLLQK
jgi:hypothetical protein